VVKLLSKIKSYISNILNPEEKEKAEQQQKTAELQQKTNTVFGTEKPTNNASSNPFLKKNGELINPNLNYQQLLDNPDISQKAKSYITTATGLTSNSDNAPTNKSDLFTSPYSEKRTTVKSWVPETPTLNIGFISEKYESRGNGGTVSSGSGDAGGISYGVSQFSTTKGSADSFVSWLKKNNPEMASAFKDYKAGTPEFSNAWKNTFSEYGENFTKVQKQYTFNNYVKILADSAKEKTGIDYTRSTALRELLYSTAVQFGPYELGLSALGNVTPNMTDEEIVNASYDKKIANYKNYFKSSSANVQEGVKKRFINERNDVLKLIKK
jgi:hypothetical protein